jgi:predicted nucleic acid-binding protein
MDAVLLDTCVLLKSYLHDTLLSVAEEGVFRPLWSDHILVELRRNLLKVGAKPDAVERRIEMMTMYFPDARVDGYEELIGSMSNHPKDRHVLAAAVAGRADVLMTENVRDFPADAVSRFGIVVTVQDDFLLGLLDLYPEAVLRALRRQASRYRREPRTLSTLLGVLAEPGQGCPDFARRCTALL